MSTRSPGVPSGAEHGRQAGRRPPGSAGPLQLAVPLRVDLAAVEDPEAERDARHADHEQRPDVVPQ